MRKLLNSLQFTLLKRCYSGEKCRLWASYSKVTVQSYLRQVSPWLVVVWSTKRVEQFHATQSTHACACMCTSMFASASTAYLRMRYGNSTWTNCLKCVAKDL